MQQHTQHTVPNTALPQADAGDGSTETTPFVNTATEEGKSEEGGPPKKLSPRGVCGPCLLSRVGHSLVCLLPLSGSITCMHRTFLTCRLRQIGDALPENH